MALASGTRLGPYKISSLIGAGGMGEVYCARDTRLDRDVAIKLLAERLACEPQSLARFQTEAKSIAALSHPNILSIFDAQLDHRPFFLVTELLEGETVRQYIQKSPSSWRRALEIGRAVAEGLAAAHSAGIIHRDIKPENIFLPKRGGVKILDFGLARFRSDLHVEADSLTVTHTGSGIFMGTVGYIAPEQARGEHLTAAADIFSLGCVLYEMVSGRRAFHRSTPASTLAAILTEHPPNIAEYAEDIPRELDLWITRCLSKQPEARPQSAGDLCLILGDLLGDDQRSRRSGHSGAGIEVQSVAVLPFSTSSSSPDAEYLADGITESLINNLAQLSNLKVVARSTVFRHKGKDVDPIQVGRELGVNSVLTGRIFQRGDMLVIGAELVSVRDGSQTWGQQYKRQLTDIFAVEEEISTEISRRLRTQLTPEDQIRLTRRYTESAEAYQLYLKGRYSWNKRTIEGMKQALVYFEQAIETDPVYARAYTGLADCMSMLMVYGALDPHKAYPRVRAAQEHSKEIDAALAETHASCGFRLLLFDWKFGEAEGALRHALELNPGYASAHQWLGFALGLTGRLDEARAAMKIARQLDPFSASINTTSVWPVYWAHLFDEAIQGFRAAAELHPGYWVAHYFLGLSYAHNRDFGPAILALRHAAEIGDSNWRYPGLGFAYAQAGESQLAKEVLANLRQIGRNQYVPATSYAAVHAGLGEIDEAIECLERAVGERDWQLAWLHYDPFWDNLRQDARFQKLQLEAGVPGR